MRKILSHMRKAVDDYDCFDLAANMDFLLVYTCTENGENPELIIYNNR